MKHIAICFAAISGLATFASASTMCVDGTLASYEALGASGCMIGTNTVFGFNNPAGITGATPIAPGSITITPSGGTSSPTLEFAVTSTASNGAVLEALIDYSISGNVYTSDSISLAGSSSSGNGAVTDIQNYCVGGAFDSTGVNNCSIGNTGNLLLLGDGSGSISFAPTALLNVTDDLTFDSGGTGTGNSAGGGAITDSYVATASAVPEPRTYLFVAACLLLVIIRKQRYPARAVVAACIIVIPATVFAASHREAPITALDHKADITDIFTFVSYDDPSKVTFILNVDPLLEPGNGPNYYPFDPNVLYAIDVDNNNTALPAVQFLVQFQTQIRAPNLFTGFAGAGTGIAAPANAPAPMGPGTVGPGGQVIPPAITSLDGPGSAGLSLRQTYTVTMVKNGVSTPLTNSTGNPLFAVPTNVGPRTMPNYPALAAQGIYSLGNGIRVFAGTVDDPFYIDLGAAFDSFNFRAGAGGGVLSPAADADDHTNLASDTVSGYNVNTIAIEVPIAMLTSTGKQELATSPAATIGVWGTTSRPRITVLRAPLPSASSGSFSQVQRMGNPLINELIIGTGMKDYWSMSLPVNDSQFASFDLDPVLARIFNAVYGIDIPAPPRLDLLPLVEYLPPIAAAGTTPGPVADLLRLNTGVAPTPAANRRRLGVIAGDNAGYPNGRRVSDDVTDISARAVAGILCGATAPCKDAAGNVFTGRQVPAIGDGVNTNDVPYQETFPYVAFAQSGRDRRHIDPGEAGCTMNAGAACPIN